MRVTVGVSQNATRIINLERRAANSNRKLKRDELSKHVSFSCNSWLRRVHGLRARSNFQCRPLRAEDVACLYGLQAVLAEQLFRTITCSHLLSPIHGVPRTGGDKVTEVKWLARQLF